jgi:hypothetical protein
MRQVYCVSAVQRVHFVTFLPSSRSTEARSAYPQPFEICTTPAEGPAVAIVTLHSPPANAYNSRAPLGLTRLSFLGPSTTEQLWTFELLDARDKSWISAGTNTQLSLVDGWQDLEFGPALPLPAQNYVNEQGEVKVRVTGAAQPWEFLNCADFDDFELQFEGDYPSAMGHLMMSKLREVAAQQYRGLVSFADHCLTKIKNLH